MNNTVVVQVEGETYSDPTEQDVTVSPSQPDSVSLQKTRTQVPPTPTTVPVAEQGPQTPLPESRVQDLPPAEPQFPDMFNRSGYTSVLVTVRRHCCVDWLGYSYYGISSSKNPQMLTT